MSLRFLTAAVREDPFVKGANVAKMWLNRTFFEAIRCDIKMLKWDFNVAFDPLEV
jgi:hypothetical protein